jgi:hypothetical protein
MTSPCPRTFDLLGTETGIAVIAVDNVAAKFGPLAAFACELKPRRTSFESANIGQLK